MRETEPAHMDERPAHAPEDSAAAGRAPIHPSLLEKMKQRIMHIRETWGPLLSARDESDDEYNFSPGRYAGQRGEEEENEDDEGHKKGHEKKRDEKKREHRKKAHEQQEDHGHGEPVMAQREARTDTREAYDLGF
ncbi:hypothetical protein BJX64DRAFT_290968 [Aspergillus heterothallicus]